jgi:signal transduction histidine kinase
MLSMQRSKVELVSDLSGKWNVAFSQSLHETKDSDFKTIELPNQKNIDPEGKDFHWMLYTRTFETPKSCTRYDGEKCAILISEIGDAAEIYVNGKLLQISGGLPPNFSYAKHYPVMALLDPNSLHQNKENNILIRVYTSKQPRSGLRNAPIGIATYKEARFYYISSVTFDVVIPVGIAVILAIFSLLFYRLTKKARSSRPIIVAFSQMCMAFTIYLVFVSNLPREFLAPWLAVHLHCLFRFLADWALFDVTWKAFSLKNNKIQNFFNMIFGSIVTIISLSTIFHTFAGETQQETLGTAIPYMLSGKMFFLAFAPMVLGIIASFISKAHERPKIWTLFYVALLSFQINDTLVFLEVFRGIYFVRFYPLLIAIFLGLEVFERYRRETERKRINAAKMRAAWDTANQVVHDIQSPLSAYRTALDLIKEDLAEESRVLFREIYTRLTGITASLSRQMKSAKDIPQLIESQESIHPISSLLDNIIAEKHLEYQKRLEINITCDLGPEAYGIFAKVAPDDFKRAISNLINNAVEATKHGVVQISLNTNDKDSIIKIKDYGKGISETGLESLGTKGFSEGKENGSGLGFHFSKTVIEEMNGKVEVISELGKGTEVTLTIPRANPPKWFIDKIRLKTSTTIVVLDDDPSIHSSWNNKLKPQKDLKPALHFTDPDQLKNWITRNKHEDVVFFIDYELLNSDYNGLNFIVDNKIMSKAILVTSRADERNIRKSCNNLGLKLLPKSMVSAIPFEINSKESLYTVLLDDDDMIIETWKHSAKRYNQKLRTFKTPKEIYSKIKTLDLKTVFYIDSRLEKARGEDVAQILYKEGFREIFIASANTDLDASVHRVIKGVVSKSPPWIQAS